MTLAKYLTALGYLAAVLSALLLVAALADEQYSYFIWPSLIGIASGLWTALIATAVSLLAEIESHLRKR